MTAPVALSRIIGVCGRLLFIALLELALLGPRRVAAQADELQVFEATLIETLLGGPEHRGRVMAHLTGGDLHLVSFLFLGTGDWSSIALRNDETGETVGEIIYNLFPDDTDGDGGVEWTYELTEEQVQVLQDGLVSVVVVAKDRPGQEIAGALQPRPGVDQAFEVRLMSRPEGSPIGSGSVLTFLEGDDLHLVGYFFNPYGLSWNSVDLYHAAPGEPGEHLRNVLLYLFTDEADGGFHATVTLTAAEIEALLARELRLKVGLDFEVRAEGQILPAPNEPPVTSAVVDPAEGTTVRIGGTGVSDPADPEAPLTTIAFAPAADPDGDPVAYLWQVSFHPALGERWSEFFDLGVDSTRIDLTVEEAAALYDSLAVGVPIDVSPGTPVTVYHRVLTTDGSHYAAGEISTFIFIRGTVTAREPGGEVPDRIAVHGNYPNPFNPTTTLVFDLPAPARVAVEVYDLMGRQVLALPEQPMPAGSLQRIAVDGAGLPSGAYLYRIVARTAAGVSTGNGRMTLLK